MAKKETQNQEKEHLSIETLKEKNKTPDAVYQGMCAANGWQRGKMVSQEEYRQAHQRFLNTVIGGGRK